MVDRPSYGFKSPGVNFVGIRKIIQTIRMPDSQTIIHILCIPVKHYGKLLPGSLTVYAECPVGISGRNSVFRCPCNRTCIPVFAVYIRKLLFITNRRFSCHTVQGCYKLGTVYLRIRRKNHSVVDFSLSGHISLFINRFCCIILPRAGFNIRKNIFIRGIGKNPEHIVFLQTVYRRCGNRNDTYSVSFCLYNSTFGIFATTDRCNFFIINGPFKSSLCCVDWIIMGIYCDRYSEGNRARSSNQFDFIR